MEDPRLLIAPGHHPRYPGACYHGLKEHFVVTRIVNTVYHQLSTFGHFPLTQLSVVPIDPVVNNYREFMDEKVKYINYQYQQGCCNLYIEFHLNAEAGGTASGTEVLIYPGSRARDFAQELVDNTSRILGTRNRGVKERPGLYVLKKTRVPAIIFEVFFISNQSEIDLYANSLGYEAVAWALYRTIKGF